MKLLKRILAILIVTMFAVASVTKCEILGVATVLICFVSMLLWANVTIFNIFKKK